MCDYVYVHMYAYAYACAYVCKWPCNAMYVYVTYVRVHNRKAEAFCMARQPRAVQVNWSNAAGTRCYWPTDASTTASMLPSTGGRPLESLERAPLMEVSRKGGTAYS